MFVVAKTPQTSNTIFFTMEFIVCSFYVCCLLFPFKGYFSIIVLKITSGSKVTFTIFPSGAMSTRRGMELMT